MSRARFQGLNVESQTLSEVPQVWPEVYAPAALGCAAWLGRRMDLIDSLVLAPPPLVNGAPWHDAEEGAATMMALQTAERPEASCVCKVSRVQSSERFGSETKSLHTKILSLWLSP